MAITGRKSIDLSLEGADEQKIACLTRSSSPSSSNSNSPPVSGVPTTEFPCPSQGDVPQCLVGLPGLQIEVIDEDEEDFICSLKSSQVSNQTVCLLTLAIEEVLPRPDAGFLKRMLRMAEVPMSKVDGFNEPVFNLRAGSLCHISIGMFTLETGLDYEISGPFRYATAKHCLLLFGFKNGSKAFVSINKPLLSSANFP